MRWKRWKLIRRRFSIGAPRMIVRGHLPWPLRWAAAALMLGFSAALALWAFEIGKDIAGVDRGIKDELARLRNEAQQLREERDKAQSIANTAESLLKTERATLEQLTAQVKQIEAENLALKADLGFFERLLPAKGEGLAIRALQAVADTDAPGRLRYQLLVMIAGKPQADFEGRYELQLSGSLDGRAWQFTPPAGPQPLKFRQSARIEGVIDHPPQAVVKTVQVRIMDSNGGVRATQSVRL